MAQSIDSLVMKKQLLIKENDKYIRLAEEDEIISIAQADSLREITSIIAQNSDRINIDILMDIREFIDKKYDEQAKIVNEPVLEQYSYIAHSMLPQKLSIPADYISPEELEARRQKLAMEQMAESIARDFEKEKLPPWQIWWRKHFPFFFGNMAWFKGQVTYINGHELAVPQRNISEEKRGYGKKY